MRLDDYHSPWQKKQQAKRRKEAEQRKAAEKRQEVERLQPSKCSEKAGDPGENERGMRRVVQWRGIFTSRFALVLLVALITTVPLVYLRGESKEWVASQLQKKARTDSLAATLGISKYFRQREESVELLASSLAEANTFNKALEIARAAAYDKERGRIISAVQFLFLPDAFNEEDVNVTGRDSYGETGGMVGALVSNGFKGQEVLCRNYGEENLYKDPWYLGAMKTQTTYLSPLSWRRKIRVISFSAPIIRQGRLVGVACIENTLGGMQEILLRDVFGVEKKREQVVFSSFPSPLITALDGTVVFPFFYNYVVNNYKEAYTDPKLSVALEKIRQGADSYMYTADTEWGEILVNCVRFDVGSGQTWILISMNDLTKAYSESGDIYSVVLALRYGAFLIVGSVLWIRRRTANAASDSNGEVIDPE